LVRDSKGYATTAWSLPGGIRVAQSPRIARQNVLDYLSGGKTVDMIAQAAITTCRDTTSAPKPNGDLPTLRIAKSPKLFQRGEGYPSASEIERSHDYRLTLRCRESNIVALLSLLMLKAVAKHLTRSA